MRRTYRVSHSSRIEPVVVEDPRDLVSLLEDLPPGDVVVTIDEEFEYGDDR